jgi:hypothetical protein
VDLKAHKPLYFFAQFNFSPASADPRTTRVAQAFSVGHFGAVLMVLLEWAHQDLNLGPAGYEPAALNQAELWAPWQAYGTSGETNLNSFERDN